MPRLRGLSSFLIWALAGCDPAATVPQDASLPDPLDVGPRTDAGPAPDGEVVDSGAVVYAEGIVHSPITSEVVASIHAITMRGVQQSNVFAKVGDSITAAASFLRCFDSGGDLGAHTQLAATLAYFRGGNAAGTSPFARSSVTAVGGWTAADALAGSPPPLDRETTAIDPRYAVVMYGTNDDRFGRTLDAYGQDMWTIVERLIAQGIVPIVSTIPAIHGDAWANARVPVFNAVVRALAQGHGVPLVDFHLAMSSLSNEGIDTDNLHPTVSPDGACVLTTVALAYGYNMRNLVTLEALDRTRSAMAGTALDASAPRRSGSGRHADPVIATLPLADLADARSGEATFASYDACGGFGGGHEIVYRLDLPQQRSIAAYVVDRDAVDVDIEILAGSLATSACVASGDTYASAVVGPGAVYIVVDSRAATTEGEFLLVVQ